MKPRLSNQQQYIVNNASGHFLVRACPGSGKTFTMAYKVTEDINSWRFPRRGVALLSFTNTAHLELSEELRKISGQSIKFPHFANTLDSFINKYIFFPYISELGFDSAKIEMIGEPYTRFYGWSRSQKCSINLNYELDGTLFYQASAKDIYDDVTIAKAKAIKQASIHKGSKFTQADANYFSLKILQAKPYILETVSARFPYIYIDEAQDTTLIHWEILKLLAANKNNERFGVIGDPDQSIYGWNGARPELFIDHQSELEAKKQVYFLTDCRRSSQKICDFYFNFSTLPSIPNASDESVATLDTIPKVVFYNQANEILTQIDNFKLKLPQKETYVTISRSTNTIGNATRLNSGNSIAIDKNPFKKDSPEPFDLMHAKADYDNGNYKASMYRAEGVYFNRNKIYSREKFLAEKEISKKEWFTTIEEELTALPETSLTTTDWSQEAEKRTKESRLFKNIDFTLKKKGTIDYGQVTASDFFVRDKAEDAKKEVDTIHSVKGKTADHVFLIMNDDQTERMIKVLSGKRVSNSEEKRIFYVAITRARRSLTFSVPKKYQPQIQKFSKILRAD